MKSKVNIIFDKDKIDILNLKHLFVIHKDAVLATCSTEGIPNIVPIHSKHIISKHKVLITDQFMKKTRDNIIRNKFAELAIQEDNTLYRIQGKCQYKTSGFMYWMAIRGAKKYAKEKAKNKNIEIKCKGIILMTVEKVEQLQLEA